MAGNTKFMGFGSGTMVRLERWGGKADVDVGEQGLKALREACYEKLPKVAPVRTGVYTGVKYDEDYGRVVVEMEPKDAQALASWISNFIKPFDVQDGTENMVKAIMTSLFEAAQAHEDYINPNHEPGVRDVDNPS